MGEPALLAALGGALLGGLVQGVTGFGAGVIMMLVLPPSLAVPQAAAVSGATCVALTASMAWRYRARVRVGAIAAPAVLYVAASSVSILVARGADQGLMKLALGAFLVLLACYLLFFQDGRPRRIEGVAALACIVVSGVCDGLFGIGGPLMVLYYLARTDDVEEYLGTIQGFFCVTLVCATAFRAVSGVLAPGLACPVALCVVGVLAGAALGARVVDRLDTDLVSRVTYLVIGLAGAVNVVGELL